MGASRLATVATILVLGVGMGLRLWRPDLAQINFENVRFTGQRWALADN